LISKTYAIGISLRQPKNSTEKAIMHRKLLKNVKNSGYREPFLVFTCKVALNKQKKILNKYFDATIAKD